jgi:hypothetical protein
VIAPLARAPLGLALALGSAGCTARLAGGSKAASCAAEGNLAYICGAEKPEDLAMIPGTRWIIASGFAPGSGLKLVDTRARTLRRWFTAAEGQIASRPTLYPDCASAPDASVFNARGISFRRKGPGEGELHVINHGGREAVEVFTVFWTKADQPPRLQWRGCLLLPDGHVGNSVASYSDGTVLVTVLTRHGTTITDFVRGEKTGLVLERPPGSRAFRPIPGTELEGNNGLETALGDDGFFVVAFGTRQLVRFDRGDESGPRWSVTAPEFMPDNIHWHGDRLLVAGMVRDEPACGGVRQIVNGVADAMACHRGYVAAALDPASRSWSILAYGEPSPSFNGVSSALVIGRELWLGSYQADRVAVRTLVGANN